MKVIIPMAGKGSRNYPHTLNKPKIFLSISGKSILIRLLEKIYKLKKKFLISDIIFIINPNKLIENHIKKITYDLTKIFPIFYYQKDSLGTADALLKAKNSLFGSIFIIFSDTLFINKIPIENEIEINKKKKNNIIWTKKTLNPQSFGIVKCDHKNKIINFIEKPKKFISDLAIIGLYYFIDGSVLKKELQIVSIENKKKNRLTEKKEFQLTSILKNMIKKGKNFVNVEVKEWMDFGDKKQTLISNSKILSLEYKKNTNLIHENSIIKNSLIINPSYIGKNSVIESSIVGPYVSIGEYTNISYSNIKKSIIQDHTKIKNFNLRNSIIGNYVHCYGLSKEINLGDYSSF